MRARAPTRNKSGVFCFFFLADAVCARVCARAVAAIDEWQWSERAFAARDSSALSPHRRRCRRHRRRRCRRRRRRLRGRRRRGRRLTRNRQVDARAPRLRALRILPPHRVPCVRSNNERRRLLTATKIVATMSERLKTKTLGAHKSKRSYLRRKNLALIVIVGGVLEQTTAAVFARNLALVAAF